MLRIADSYYEHGRSHNLLKIKAPEIKYLWIARMIMLSLYFTNNVNEPLSVDNAFIE